MTLIKPIWCEFPSILLNKSLKRWEKLSKINKRYDSNKDEMMWILHPKNKRYVTFIQHRRVMGIGIGSITGVILSKILGIGFLLVLVLLRDIQRYWYWVLLRAFVRYWVLVLGSNFWYCPSLVYITIQLTALDNFFTLARPSADMWLTQLVSPWPK